MHALAKDHCAGNNGEDRFQTQDQGCFRRIGVSLCHHLQCVGEAAGQDAGIQDREPVRQNSGDVHRLKDEHQYDADRPCPEELYAGEFDSVGLGREIVDDHDVACEGEGAQQDEEVALLQVESFCRVDAQKVQPDNAQDYGHPDHGFDLLAQEQGQEGDDDAVQGCDEAGVTGGGEVDAVLLQGGCHEQSRTAADPAYDPHLPVLLLFFLRPVVHRILFLLHGIHDQDHRDQCQSADEGSYSVIGKGSDVSAHLLGNECGSPDECRDEQHDICSCSLTHVVTSFISFLYLCHYYIEKAGYLQAA